MSRHLFFCVLLPLLLLIGCTCGPASARSVVQSKNSVDLFVQKQTKIPERVGQAEPKRDVEHLALPILLAADGLMVALAEARSFYLNNRVNIGIAARYIATEGRDWAQKAMEGDGKNWAMQLAMAGRDVRKNEDLLFTRTPLSVVKGNKIYLFTVSFVDGEGKSGDEHEAEPYFELAVGEVTGSKGNAAGKTIQWKKLESESKQLTQQFKDRSLRLFAFFGSAFLTEDGRIVFAMGALNQTGKTVTTIVQSTGEEGAKWELSTVEANADCSSFSLSEWKGRLAKIPISCIKGDEMGKLYHMETVWPHAHGSFSHLWDNLKNKRDFTTVTIDRKTVLLFTYSVPGRVKGEKESVHLGLTDGNRIHDVGMIAADYFLMVSGGFSYTNGELLFFHQWWGYNPGNLTLTRLTDELKTIKSVLRTWAENDEYLSWPCEETVSEGAPVGTLCVTPVSTAGLVGFLSNYTSENTWQDDYLYLNAAVRGGTKVDNGFVFKGTNAGAKWAVGHQGTSNVHYPLTHGVTVVATVTVHEVPQDDSPLLTVGGTGIKRLGLWYGGKEWKVRSESDGVATHAGSSVTKEAYRVALVLHNSNISAYVNGNLVGETLQIPEQPETPFSAEDLFIGSYKEDGAKEDSVKDTVSHVAVTNVLLYNRPLSDTELKTLNKRTVKNSQPRKRRDRNQQPSGDDDGKEQLTIDAQKKNSALKMVGLRDSSVRVPAAGALLFVISLWGISDLFWAKGNTLI